MMLMLLAIVTAAVDSSTSHVVPQSSEKPASVVAFENARMSIRAKFRGQIFSDQFPPSQFRGIATGDQVAYFNDGRADGVCGRLEDGTPLYGLEDAWLKNKHGVWGKEQRLVPAQLLTGQENVQSSLALDYRSIGMVPSGGVEIMNAPTSIIEASLPQPAVGQTVEWEETITDDGIHVVKRSIAGQEGKVIWHIDPALNWNATRVELWNANEALYTVYNEYEKINDVWVPTKSVLDEWNGQVKVAVDLKYDEVNTNRIPAQLEPELIGVWVGTPVNVRRGDRSEQMFWDGLWLTDHKDLYDRISSSEIDLDPRIKDLRAAQDSEIAKRTINGRRPQTVAELYSTPYPPLSKEAKPAESEESPATRFELAKKLRLATTTAPADAWDHFVQEFIRKYHLTQDQAQRCENILKECKERRDNYLNGAKPKLEQVAKTTPKNASEARLAEEKLNVLLEPVNRLFQQMKKRLEKIPTRKQLQDHADAPQSRPARK